MAELSFGSSLSIFTFMRPPPPPSEYGRNVVTVFVSSPTFLFGTDANMLDWRDARIFFFYFKRKMGFRGLNGLEEMWKKKEDRKGKISNSLSREDF